MSKLNKNKLVIDFETEKPGIDQYFFTINENISLENDIIQNDMLIEKQDILNNYHLSNYSTQNYTDTNDNEMGFYKSPMIKMINKHSKASSSSLLKAISGDKISKKNKSYEESPFCKLLNESDRHSTDKYQILADFQEIEDNGEDIEERVNIL